LRDKFSGLSQQEKIDLATKIAGKDHMSKLLAIVNSNKDAFDQVSTAIDGASGAGDRMAKTMNDNLAGSVENMRGSVETLQIKLGKALAPAFRLAADAVASLANKLGPLADMMAGPINTAVTEFSMGLSGSMKIIKGEQLDGPFLKFGLALRTDVVPAVKDFISFIGPIASKIWDIYSAISPLSIAFQTLQGFLTGGVNGAIESFEEAIVNAGRALGVDLTEPINTVNQLFIGTLIPAFNEIGNGVNTVLTTLAPFGSTIGEIATIMGGFGIAAVAIPPVLTAIGVAFAALTSPIALVVAGVAGLATVWATDFGGIRTAIEQTFTNTLIPAFQKVGDFIGSTVIPKLGELANFVGTTIGPVVEKFAGFIADPLVPVLGKIGAAIAEFVIPFLTNVATVVATVVGPPLTELANFISSTLIPAFSTIATWIGNNVVPALTAVGDFINQNVMPVLTTLAGYLGGALKTAFQGLETVVKGAWDNISTAISTVWNTVSGIFDTIKNVLSGDFSGAWNSLKGVVETVWNGISSIISTTWNTISGIFDTIATNLGGRSKLPGTGLKPLLV
jgi:hypothetical protein